MPRRVSITLLLLLASVASGGQGTKLSESVTADGDVIEMFIGSSPTFGYPAPRKSWVLSDLPNAKALAACKDPECVYQQLPAEIVKELNEPVVAPQHLLPLPESNVLTDTP